MIITELNEKQQAMLDQLQQANSFGLKNVFVSAPLDLVTWSKAGKPSTWQFQEERGEYTLFVDPAWGKNALFDGTKLVEVWTFTNVIKPFVDKGFIIIQDNESGFNSWFFVPANDL